MKKYLLSLAVAMVAVVGFTACSNDDFPGLAIDEGMPLYVHVINPEQTRAVASESGRPFLFGYGDVLKVTHTGPDDTYYDFSMGSMYFTSSQAKPTDKPEYWIAYYPSDSISLRSQSGALDDLPKNYALAGFTNPAVTGADGLVMDMVPQVAILKVVNIKGSVDINLMTDNAHWVTGLTAKKDLAGFNVSTTSTSYPPVLRTDKKGVYYIAVPAGVPLTVRDGISVLLTAPEGGFTAGQFYAVTLSEPTWTKSLGTDSATRIVIQNHADVSGYVLDMNHQKMNDEGTAWAVLEGTTLKIQTSEEKVKGTNTKMNYGMFWNYSKVTSISGLDLIDMSEVTDMRYMFSNCQSLESVDLSGMNTGSVTSMSHLFDNCNSLTTVNLSGLNTANVTDMSYMFSRCSNLTDADLSGLNTEKVGDMAYMFSNCNKLSSLNLSGLNTSEVSNTTYMFYGCSSLTELDLSSFNTAKVSTMMYMFNNCYNLASLTLSNQFECPMISFDMFTNCGRSVTPNEKGEKCVVYGVTDQEIKNALANSVFTGWNAKNMKFYEEEEASSPEE